MKNEKLVFTFNSATCENNIATINIDCEMIDHNKEIIKEQTFFGKKGKVFCGYETVTKNINLLIYIKKEYFDMLQEQNFNWLSVIESKFVEFGAKAPENTINIKMTRNQRHNGDIYYTGKGEQLYIYEYQLKDIIIQKIIEQIKPLTAKLNDLDPTVYLFGLTQEASIYLKQENLSMLGFRGGNFIQYTLPAIKYCLNKKEFLIEQPNYYKDFKGFEAIGLYNSNIDISKLSQTDIKEMSLDEILSYLNDQCKILNS